MLKLKIVLSESFDEATSKFIATEVFELNLEHSLVSLSKWESTHKKPFLREGEKSDVEVLDYFRCMILNEEYPENIFDYFRQADVDSVAAYIDDSMTATWFNKSRKPSKKSSETITSELVYYWMVSYKIPWEAQHWHINRLFTLIEVFNAKNTKPEKRSRAEIMAERQALNEQRRKQFNTKG